MSAEHLPGEHDSTGTPERADKSVDGIDQAQLQELFRMLAEIHLAMHTVMDDDARRLREMEHAVRLKDQQQIEERTHAPGVEHPIAA
jgi:hypothetical protein